MKTTVTILAAIAFCAACRPSQCHLDKEFVKDYQRHLQIIVKEERGDSTDIDEYRNALSYFYKITGFLPRADYSSTVGYRDRVKYEEDINTLNAWLKKEKCAFTKKESDSLLSIRLLGEK